MQKPVNHRVKGNQSNLMKPSLSYQHKITTCMKLVCDANMRRQGKLYVTKYPVLINQLIRLFNSKKNP